jgi:uncharacterized protein YjiS (DUF1127 family)
MLLLQDVKLAPQRSSKAVSIASPARAHRPAREAPIDHAAEQSRSWLRGIRQVIGLWLRRRSDRAVLRSLSLRDIHDFCPRHTEAEAEMSKPFWRS